jgi:uncharacterized tellurite resistance protein B-like protein
MRIFQIMRSGAPRRRRRSTGKRGSFERVSLQLTILVGLANADGEILASEYERLHDIAARLATAETRDRVVGQLQMLLAAPPTEEDVLRTVIMAGGAGRLTRQLVDDISSLANADHVIHPAEDRLLRLMSAVGGARPLSLRPPPAAALSDAERAFLERVERDVRSGGAAEAQSEADDPDAAAA